MELTVPAAVARTARYFGDAEAVAEPGGVRLSYRELDERAAAVTGALIDAGIGPGDRVAIWAPNGSEWLLAALGTLGQRVRIELPSGVVEGTATDVDADGRLVVLDACAVTHRFSAGDVVHLRPV